MTKPKTLNDIRITRNTHANVIIVEGLTEPITDFLVWFEENISSGEIQAYPTTFMTDEDFLKRAVDSHTTLAKLRGYALLWSEGSANDIAWLQKRWESATD